MPATTTSNTQTRLDSLIAEENLLQFPYFNQKVAWDIGNELRANAIEKHAKVAINISVGEQCLFHCALDGATLDNQEWVRRKSNVTKRFQRSSWYMKHYLEMKGKNIEQASFIDEKDYSPFGGSFPIRVKNTGMIGTITVSGLPQHEDHQLIVDVLSQYLKKE
ncbi:MULTISPECIES: heme-degrading domain-containing protein [Vibrio]|uniref:heme-degrading domain-containing protein n=1 Tax=Vibrio TaxID=662 RepID=UPI00148DBA33|nr:MULTISPECIES: heme-degrading domain-containing protein [Vibrio]MCG9659890.1 heme-degrading domain-containing protein [Vibrio mediterranei]MDA0110065.1 heme-degrading domain-containing protein [Vibrio sp. La 4.2.2]NOH30975.1 heme-degrading domain-containing protein [Vibrio mediterranei]USD99313.1 heme-degrading domain-containing protein [Vibrio sp. SCSIO 43133]